MRTVQSTGITILAALFVGLTPSIAIAAETSESAAGVQHWGKVFLMFGLVLLAGKVGSIVEKFNQPAVIGELLAGIILAMAGYAGFALIQDTAESQYVALLSSFGAVLLLFSIGLESNVADMRRVGVSALLVAIIGVSVPFALGTFVLGPIFFGDESLNSRLFLGAALVATSVGITASVFKSMGITRSRMAQTVLGAAVIDDVLGLIVLAMVSSLASGGEMSATVISVLFLKSFGFLGGALAIGMLAADPLSRVFSRISSGTGMKLSVALGLALLFAYLAELFGLEPIIGAFAAGLILEAVHFSYFEDPSFIHDLKAINYESKEDEASIQKVIVRHRHTHVEDLIGTLNLVFVPIFFVYTGMQIDIGSLLQPNLYLIALIISIAAIFGKVVAGIAAQGGMNEKLLVGVSMVPRGEVGLIFAATGQSLGVLSEELFSVIVLVVIITTFVSPPVIKYITARPGVMASLAR